MYSCYEGCWCDGSCLDWEEEEEFEGEDEEND